MWNHLFHVLVLSPEERRAGKWQRGRVRRGLGWGHCSSDAGMKNKRQRRRGSPSAPVEGGWKGKLSQELVGYPALPQCPGRPTSAACAALILRPDLEMLCTSKNADKARRGCLVPRLTPCRACGGRLPPVSAGRARELFLLLLNPGRCSKPHWFL